MKKSYGIIVKFNTGDIIPSIRKMENSINDILNDFNLKERLCLETETQFGVLTIDEVLSPDKQKELIDILNDEFSKAGKNMVCTGLKELV